VSLWRATVFLWTASLRNRVLRQVRRLKNPRYLAATVVGLGYLWSLFFRRLGHTSGGERDPRQLVFLEGFLTVVALLVLLSAWVLGSNRAQVTFSEPEIQFFFPGPLSRGALLGYKVGKSLLLTLISALFSSFTVGSLFSAHRGYFLIGTWLGFATLGFHATAASLTRASIAEHGRRAFLRRPVALLVLAGLVGLVVHAIWRLPPRPPEDAGLFTRLDWAVDAFQSPGVALLLFPLHAPIRLAMATSLPDFLVALPGAMVSLAAHAYWVVSSDVAFEEASLEVAEARARRMEQFRSQGRVPLGTRGRKFRLRLSARGRPEWALVWKNIIAARRTVAPVLALLGVLVAAAAGLGAFVSTRREYLDLSPLWAAVSAGSLALVAFSILLGPSLVRVDLRQDLPVIDILRALPLTGVEVMRAELLAPGLLLGVGQWALLGLSLLCSASLPIPWVSLGERVSLAVAVALVGPMLSFAGLAVQNLAVLLFPAWTVVDRNQLRGIEAMGQRLLTSAGTLLVLMLGVVPAALLGGGVMLALSLGLGMGWYAAPIAGAVGAGVLGVELHFALQWLGVLFSRFDVTE